MLRGFWNIRNGSRSFQGAARDRHGRGTGCGGRHAALRRQRVRRTVKSCGSDTLKPVSSWRRQTAGDGGNRARLTGEITGQAVNHCAGNAGRSGKPAVTTRMLSTLHTRLRVHRAPGIPCALCLEGDIDSKPRTHCAARSRTCISQRGCRGFRKSPGARQPCERRAHHPHRC